MQLAFKALEDSKHGGGNDNGGGGKVEEQSDYEAAFYRIEQYGFQVGQRLIERLLLHTQSPRLAENIDAIKYLCKEFWMVTFGKGIDNLKTNHRGVYVLHDNNFQWVHRFSIDSNAPETAKMAVLVIITLTISQVSKYFFSSI